MKNFYPLVYIFIVLTILVSCKNDQDRDGVVDSKDECADTRSGEEVDEKGCSPSQLAESTPNCEDKGGVVFMDHEIILRFPEGDKDLERLKVIRENSDEIDYKLKEKFGEILKKYYEEGPDLDSLISAVMDFEFCSCGYLSPVLVKLNPDFTFETETKLDNLKKKDTAEADVEGDLNFNFSVFPNETTKEDSKLYLAEDNGEFIKLRGEFESQSNNVIAILDTGLDLMGQYHDSENDAQNLIYKFKEFDSSSKCLGTYKGSGWNFVDDNDNFNEDSSGSGHGTLVTRALTNELDHLGLRDNYSLLPLKVFNSEGKGSYWNVVCAMAYINDIQRETRNVNTGSQGDIKLINASFGGSFEALPDAEIGILKKFIDDLENSALFVTSAGNCGEDTDNSILHFPSGYSSKNIVSVGGYKMGENSILTIDQSSNYGITSIDVAAPFTLNKLETYIMDGGAKVFGSATVQGTSYSTPLVSAKIFEIYLNNLGKKPEEIIEIFYENPNTQQDVNLGSFFRSSRFYEPKQK